jgi:phenylalanine-4-hydroxylase
MTEDVRFSEDLHKIWATLYEKLWPRVKRHACRDYLEGARILNLPKDRLPTVEYLNDGITPRTGWTIERTTVRYTDAKPWYKKFAQRIFLITDYMRSWEEIDWTPEPDMWHDIFGHLPFMVLPHYAELEEMFAPAFLAAKDDNQRDNIKRLAWFSTEFGLIREEGRLKLFGAGLISGADELENVIEGKVPNQPFTIENVVQFDKFVWEHNKMLFVIESLEQLKEELKRYFDPICAGEEPALTQN